MQHFSKFFILLNLLSAIAVAQPCSDLFISEYVEGSSFNKAIEIYNPTTAAVQMDGYQLLLFSNGGDSASFKLKLHGSLASHDVYVIVHPQADATLLLPLADTTNIVCNWNGNDAILLVNNNAGDTIDGIGVVGEDPGSEWLVSGGSTKDHTLVRTVETQEGTLDWSTGSQQWYAYAQNDFSQLGSHDVNTCPAANPQISISADSTSIPENAGTFFVKVNILNPNTNATSCQVKVTGGSATQGTDYTFTEQTVTFPANNGDPVLVSVPVTNDGISEPDESITFTLQNPTNGATFSASSLTMTIIDDDGLGINAANQYTLKAYPNPAGNVLHIASPYASGEITLQNLLGENVLLQTFSSRQTNLDVEQLPAGIYLLKISNGTSVLLQQVVKN
ncbi:MAG: lamin tail domain-containing protein [Chitinophagales bacterium]|nr:lamin tail domain-containing protein [Chitinophagales bacterium]